MTLTLGKLIIRVDEIDIQCGQFEPEDDRRRLGRKGTGF
jgi:hypothetical protein